MSLQRLGELSKDQGDAEQELGIAPLVDIVFILLIFFMVTSTFTRDLELEVDRPDATSAKTVKDSPVRVAIDSTGAMTVDGQRATAWSLQRTVRSHLEASKAEHVLVVADKSLHTSSLITAVDECRLAGAQSVAVAVNER